MDISFVAGLGSSLPLFLVALQVCPEGESVTDSILSVTLFYKYMSSPTHTAPYIYISRDILLPVYMYLLYLLNGTATAWMKSSVFIHLTQLPSNPILFGFGRLALRCDFSETKIQPLTLQIQFVHTATTAHRTLLWISLLIITVNLSPIIDLFAKPLVQEPHHPFER